MIALPLRSVLDVLPESFPQANRALEKGELYLPIGKVLSQLSTGSVKIPFSEIREAAPPGLFPDDSTHDEKPVELPLSEILFRLPASAFSRRDAQKRLDAPPEVRDLFGSRGQALPQPPAEASAPRPTLKPVAATPGGVRVPPPPPLAPARMSSIPSSTASFPAPPLPLPAPRPTVPVGTTSATIPRPSMAAVSPVGGVKPPPGGALAEASVPGGNALAVSLGLISASWPDAIRQEITEANVPEAQVSLPSDKVEQGMRVGKLSFSWKDLGQWSQPMINTASATQATMVDIPLKVIAPLFIAQHRPGKAQKRVAIGENIPDLFSGSGGGVKPVMSRPDRAAIPPPRLPVPSASQPILPPPAQASSAVGVRELTPSPAEAETPKTAASVLGEIFGQPSKRDWSPSEIVQKTMALKGVAGVLIAMQDGLMVAGQLTPPLEAENIAAFLPQIFGRMTQYTNQLNLGGLTSLSLGLGSGSWHVLKSGNIYFAVAGKTGETLSMAQLTSIAIELGKQTK